METTSERILSKRYRLEGVLGEGSMAQVFRATDLLLERPVAIKVLRPQFTADPNLVQRFEAEARAVARLRHPNIVEVYDVGEDQGVRFIVEELVDGRSLRQILDTEGPLPLHRAADYARQIARALDAAHRQGLVHRDIKPQNVLVDQQGVVKVVDFGIARAMTDVRGTQQGFFWGSPAYSAPELARGEAPTPATDIYSLGVVLFEMLTGRLPFEGADPLAVILGHIQQPPPPPSKLRPSLPPAVDQVVLTSLAKEPAQRFASALHFEAALRSLVDSSASSTSVLSTVPATSPAARTLPGTPRVQAHPRDAPSGTVSLVGLITVLLVAAGIGYLAYLAAPSLLQGVLSAVTPTTVAPSPTPLPHVDTPRLLGVSLEDAKKVAQDAGLKLTIGEERYDASVPQGHIVSQDPAPNVSVPPGSTITVIVSKGPEPVTVPGLINVPYPVAKGILEALGLQVQRSDEPSSTVADGAVIRSTPPFGSTVQPGTTVTLVVSVGNKVKVPDVFNWPLAEAEKAIVDAGLKVGSVNYQTQEDIPHFDITKVGVGHVLSVTPDFNTWVPRGTVINIAVRAK